MFPFQGMESVVGSPIHVLSQIYGDPKGPRKEMRGRAMGFPQSHQKRSWRRRNSSDRENFEVVEGGRGPDTHSCRVAGYGTPEWIKCQLSGSLGKGALEQSEWRGAQRVGTVDDNPDTSFFGKDAALFDDELKRICQRIKYMVRCL